MATVSPRTDCGINNTKIVFEVGIIKRNVLPTFYPNRSAVWPIRPLRRQISEGNRVWYPRGR